jgi:predicted amidophosphoribosyltransferase
VHGKSLNPASDFQVSSSVRGKNIILIDDVITRGQTFYDTARKLMAAGAASVTGLFLAKTVHPAA